MTGWPEDSQSSTSKPISFRCFASQFAHFFVSESNAKKIGLPISPEIQGKAQLVR